MVSVKYLFCVVSMSISIAGLGQDLKDNSGVGGLKAPCDSSEVLMYLAPTGPDAGKLIDLKKWSRWDLSEKFLAKDWNVIAQGRQGSCTSFAVSNAISIERSIDAFLLGKSNEVYKLSPSFIFNIAKGKYAEPYRSNCSEGITFIDAFLGARDKGVASIGKYPYKPIATGCSFSVIDPIVIKEAEKMKIVNFQRPYISTDNFKRLLLDTPFYPICIGVYLNKEYEDARDFYHGRWTKKGIPSLKVMHAMLIVGFDDAINSFKVLAWQGATKGDAGFMWISYPLIEDREVVFDAYICNHNSTIIDPQVGARAGAEMDETKDRPEILAAIRSNSIFINDSISFWIKSGYYSNKDKFKISCNYVSSEKKRAAFRINNVENGVLIKDDIYLSVGTSYCFQDGGRNYKMKLVEIAGRGKNIFKKAAVIIFTRNSSCE